MAAMMICISYRSRINDLHHLSPLFGPSVGSCMMQANRYYTTTSRHAEDSPPSLHVLWSTRSQLGCHVFATALSRPMNRTSRRGQNHRCSFSADLSSPSRSTQSDIVGPSHDSRRCRDRAFKFATSTLANCTSRLWRNCKISAALNATMPMPSTKMLFTCLHKLVLIASIHPGYACRSCPFLSERLRNHHG